jgi:hypothetical protein
MALTGDHEGLGRLDILKDKIEDSLILSTTQHQFLPTEKLNEIFTLAEIKGAVQELKCSPADRIKLADTIYDEGKRVFAMLIYHDCPDLIIEFRKHDFLDRQLPLRDDMTFVGRYSRRLAQDKWHFCPYVFPGGMHESHRELPDRMIVPIINTEPIGEGTFGNVERITVAPLHHNFIDQGVCTSSIGH